MSWFDASFFIVPILVLVVGAVSGVISERRHLASLSRREQVAGPFLTDLSRPPAGFVVTNARLVFGEVVLGAHRGKEFLSLLRNLVGGEVVSLQKLLTHARREARLRMVDEARAAGADFVLNVRFEICEVGGKAADVICYGTAVSRR
jgi:uncharacterized protein YbjQ (UPF0145 family)